MLFGNLNVVGGHFNGKGMLGYDKAFAPPFLPGRKVFC